MFFGGGTPSLMRPQTVQAILDAIARALAGRAGTPKSRWRPIRPASRPAAFAAIAPPGVNRVSIGVQALKDEADLKALGRRHSVAEAIEAVKTGASIFPRYFVRPDLRPPRPDRGAHGARNCQSAMKLAGEHLSLYQLTIEPDTIFERLWRRRQAQRCPTRNSAAPVRHDAGNRRGAWPAGLRSLQSRPARRGEPAQSRLLALRRICRRRPRRAWPGRTSARAARAGDRAAPRNVARPGRERRPRPDRERRADARGAERRISADGPAPARGHRRRRATKR